jgi:hypothetical protein
MRKPAETAARVNRESPLRLPDVSASPETAAREQGNRKGCPYGFRSKPKRLERWLSLLLLLELTQKKYKTLTMSGLTLAKVFA